MSGTKNERPVWSRVALVVLTLAIVLSACAAPSGGSTTGGQTAATAVPAAAAAPAATAAPGSTEAAPTVDAAAPTEAPAPAATEAPTNVPPTSAAPTTAPEPTAAPAPTEAPAATGGVSFANDVLPIFETSCIKCHGGADGEKGELNLTTYEKVMQGGEEGSDIMPGDAANSLLHQMINTGKMPKRASKLSQEQIDLIGQWINEGALNN